MNIRAKKKGKGNRGMTFALVSLFTLVVVHVLHRPVQTTKTTSNQNNKVLNQNNNTRIESFDLIFGFSSSGKSTYIEQIYGGSNNVRLVGLVGLGFTEHASERKLAVAFDQCLQQHPQNKNQNSSTPSKNKPFVIHINLFILVMSYSRHTLFCKYLRTILNYPATIHAIGLVTEPELHLSNIRQRKFTEGKQGNYHRVADWQRLAQENDLPGIFRLFVEEFLSANEIDVSYIQSKPNYTFDPLPDLQSAVSILSPSAASESEVKEFYNTFKVKLYHDIPLPFDLQVKGGYNHKPSRDLFFTQVNLTAKTVLDVGSANGYFALEAARVGAARVRGIELNHDRLKTAVAFKKLWGLSNVEFLPLNTFDTCWQTPFKSKGYDVVFLLNVIHHIPEPIRMLRLATNMARHALVMELPQPMDPTIMPRHYPETMQLKATGALNSTVPAVFVLKDYHTQFTLTSAAVQKIVGHDCKEFQETQSPITGRILLVCLKEESKP